MSELDIAGHIYYVLIFIGLLLIATKSQLGWFFRFLGELGWVWLGIEMGMTSIWMWGIVFAAVDLYGWLNWRKNGNLQAD